MDAESARASAVMSPRYAAGQIPLTTSTRAWCVSGGGGIAPDAALRHNGADPMKAYLVTTATLFGLLVLVHAWRFVAEGRGVLRDPFYVGATLAALALLPWALRLLRGGRRAGD